MLGISPRHLLIPSQTPDTHSDATRHPLRRPAAPTQTPDTPQAPRCTHPDVRLLSRGPTPTQSLRDTHSGARHPTRRPAAPTLTPLGTQPDEGHSFRRPTSTQTYDTQMIVQPPLYGAKTQCIFQFVKESFT